jgi:hypothetical protein
MTYQFMMDSMRHELDSLARARVLPGRTGDREWERSLARSMESIRRLPQSFSVPSVVVDPSNPSAPTMVMQWRLFDSTRARRVVIASRFVNGTASSSLNAYTRAAADSLRARVRARGLYDLVAVDPETDQRLISDPMSATSTNSGFALSGFFIARRDSVFLQVHAVDMRRGTTFRGFKGPAAPLDDPLRGADEVWSQVLGWMDRPVRTRVAPPSP